MRSNIIHDSSRFLVTSYGNGLAYELVNKGEARAVFFQGDDAAIFRNSFETLAYGRPQMSFADAYGCLWSDYAESSTEWGVRSNEPV